MLTAPTAEDLYPSRVDPEARMLARRDPVVHGATDGPLDASQCAAFDRDGFLVLPGLLSPAEVASLDARVQDLAAREAIQGLEETIREPDGGEVRSVFRFHALDDVLARLVRDRRLVGPVAQLLGGPVYVHQSRVNLKPGFSGKDFYWHSDFETWHVEDGMPRMRAVSASIALTDNEVFNGPLMLIPGSHRVFVTCIGETPDDHYRQSLRRQEYGVPDQVSLRRLADRGGIVAPTGPAGTVVLFDCNTMHGSNSNISPYPRRNAFVVYNSVENQLVEPFGRTRPRPEFVAHRQDVTPLVPEPR
ncbi:MAG: ectoine hydroxylase [Vicinamibacterales bacterium]